MARHPLPPFQRRRAFLLCAVSVVLVLGSTLWSAAQKRRQLIRQLLAWRIPKGSDQYGATLTLSPDGKQLTYGFSSKNSSQNDRIRVFDAQTGDFLGDGPTPASSSWPRSVVADAQLKSEERNGIIAWLPDTNDDSRQNIHIDRRGRTSLELKAPASFSWTNTLYALRLSPDGNLLTALGKSALWEIDVKSQKVLRVVRPKNVDKVTWGSEWDGAKTEDCTLSLDGRFIVTLAQRPTLYDASTGQKIREVGQRLETQCGGCGCIEPKTGFSPDGKLMWAAEDSSGGNVAFWHVSDGKKVWQHVFGDWHFDPTGKYVISPGELLVQSTATGRAVCHLQSYSDFDVFTFSPDGRQLYILNEDGRIHHYHLP